MDDFRNQLVRIPLKQRSSGLGSSGQESFLLAEGANRRISSRQGTERRRKRTVTEWMLNKGTLNVTPALQTCYNEKKNSMVIQLVHTTKVDEQTSLPMLNNTLTAGRASKKEEHAWINATMDNRVGGGEPAGTRALTP